MSKLFKSDRVFIDGALRNGAILVNTDGKIEEVFLNASAVEQWLDKNSVQQVFDYTGLVIMPGLIDSHVHINEPGRTEWEGFETATKAAASGGFTTIVDMPLNSIPPTTTISNLLEKQKATVGKLYTDIGFWGGIVPGNDDQLAGLVSHGVVGFKCFLCPSGVDEFPNVSEEEVELAYKRLENLNALIAFHAEKCDGVNIETPTGDVHEFETYLKTRPASLELRAIEMISRVIQKYPSVRTHIVHLSAADAIPTIRECRKVVGKRLTVETCHHYLSLLANDVPRNRVDFKCCPPIRDERNQQALWQGIKDGDINMVVSDHSPSTAEMKLLVNGPDYGNFLKSWGGISSVQFGLSLFWTNCQQYGLELKDMQRLMCEETAKLCGFQNKKGKFEKGFDADLCIWNPMEEFIVTEDIIHFKNKANPYMGKTLKGCVHATVVRGNFAFKRSETNPFRFVGQIIRGQK